MTSNLHSVLDPTTLRLFVAVCEEGTIAGAAEREFIAASAISKRIADVEDRIDTSLLHRRQRGVVPTAAGHVLLKQAKVILQRLTQLQAELGLHASGALGRVRMVADGSSITESLLDELSAFLVIHEKICLELEERASADISRCIVEGIADIGICRATALTSVLETKTLRSHRFVVLMCETHPLADRSSLGFGETLGHDHVELPLHSAILESMHESAIARGKKVRFRVRLPSLEAALRMIRSGLVVGVFPEAVADRYAAAYGLRVAQLTDAWAVLKLVLCARNVALLTPAARLLFEHLNAQLVSVPEFAVGDASIANDF